MTRTIAIVMLAVLTGLGAAHAADDRGPAAGTKMLDIGTPPDQTGMPRTMASMMGEKGMVFLFFRSAAWCPFCQAQLVELNGGVKEIEKRGYKLAALSYDPTDVLQGFTGKRGLSFTLLSDPKSEVIDRYGLRDPAYPVGNKAHGVPKPVIFIVGRDGTIKAKLFEESFKNRPSLALLLETIDKAK